MSVLEVAAKYRYELLYNKWKMGTDVIERFQQEPPYGWIVSRDQRDPNATATLLDRLIVLGTEVYTADQAFTHAGISYPAGSFVIPTSQPFGLFVKNVMEAKVENIYVIASALLVLFAAMMHPHTSFAIAAALLVASAIYRFVERQERERGYLNG